jgi:protease IV
MGTLILITLEPNALPMRNFFKTILATVLGLTIFSAIGAGGLVLLAFSLAQREEEPLKLTEKTVLVYDLGTSLSDSPAQLDLSVADTIVNGPPTAPLTLRGLAQTLKAAARDPNIAALYLESSGGVPVGNASLKEIRRALEVFRDSGKPIVAYGLNWSESEYYLGSVAQTLAINPAGEVEINGFGAEVRFYAGALQKYGVGVQVARVGQYKAAVEPYLKTGFSAQSRQQTKELLGDLWGDYLKTIGQARKIPEAGLRAMVQERGSFLAAQAQDRNLVDAVMNDDEVIARLRSFTEDEDSDSAPKDDQGQELKGKDSKTKDSKAKDSNGKDSKPKDSKPKDSKAKDSKDKDLTDENTDESDYPSISLRGYASIAEEANQKGVNKDGDRVAIIYAEGEIVNGRDSQSVSSDRLVETLRSVQSDDDVKAVVLRINSPGGSATAASLIGHEVERLAEKKPLVVSMGDYAASGGYWIAAPSRLIFAEPTTITGSIGAYGLSVNVKKIANDNGITWDSVTTEPFANSDTITRPKTDRELAINQAAAESIYDRFLQLVSDGRKLPIDRVKTIAQGRVWSGIAAKKVGLVDRLGGLDQAITAAAKLAELEEWAVEEYPKSKRFEDAVLSQFLTKLSPIVGLNWGGQFGGQFGGKLATRSVDPLSGLVRDVERDLGPLSRLSDPQQVYVRLPFSIEVK